jgi:hypothetical protein
MMNELIGLPERGEEPHIILISVEKQNFYLFEGEEFLNQLLLEDGVYPRPVHCIGFASSIDLSIFIGDGKSLSQFWEINPEIVDRLRRNDHLLEVEAGGS